MKDNILAKIKFILLITTIISMSACGYESQTLIADENAMNYYGNDKVLAAQLQHPFSLVLEKKLSESSEYSNLIRAFLVDIDGRGTEGMVVQIPLGDSNSFTSILYFSIRGEIAYKNLGIHGGERGTAVLIPSNRVINIIGSGGMLYTLFYLDDGILVEETIIIRSLVDWYLSENSDYEIPIYEHYLNGTLITQQEFEDVFKRYNLGNIHFHTTEEFQEQIEYILSMILVE